jgi:uncharacterized protein YbaA (DUF1428 family)
MFMYAAKYKNIVKNIGYNRAIVYLADDGTSCLQEYNVPRDGRTNEELVKYAWKLYEEEHKDEYEYNPMYSESEARFIMESEAEDMKREQEEVLWYLHDNNELT